MKSYIKISSFFFAAMVVLMTGCLKDKEYDNLAIQSVRSNGGQNVIEIGLTATNNVNYLLISLPNINRDTTFNLIPVLLNDSKPAPVDIKVVLTLNPSLIGDYNANSDPHTDHQDAPASAYTIVNPPATGGGYVVTIPAGSTVGYLQARVNPATNFLGNDYAVGFQISRIETPGYLVSSNLSKGVVAIGIKNDWEGDYEVTGFFQHPTLPRSIDQEEYLKTAGATSLFKTLGDLSGTNVILVINNSVPGDIKPVNILPGPGTSGTTASVQPVSGDPVYNNTYNSLTKTFWLHYAYPNPGPTREITEKVQLVP